ncbi:MAG: bifunctional riboflavin kinase/FAD synthetase [Proteobacteria bacterium]|mgnify:CR=1 FL=1|jgi:riboflavin kinase / FMN adenylyltransferase|nr:bifunctional riboflavin kinase/FAD synthetase [Pseudomonadota bacterium]
MKFINGVENLTEEHCGSVVTIGNYDGVHCGHQHVIGGLIKEARARSLKATVITFEPLAREYFSPSEPVGRLTSIEERAELLFELGVEQVLCINFDHKLAEQQHGEFVRSTLVDGLGVEHLVVGDDFKFGHNREGDFAFLKQAGERYGFTVSLAESFEIDGVRVSSNAIREALDVGDIATAEVYFGRSFVLNGPIIEGDRMGHTIGFPTANVDVGNRYLPVNGVFAAEACLQDGLAQHRWREAVANIGTRPTLDGQDRRFEVHILDFDKDVYGKDLKVRFVERLRDEQKFDGLDQLVAQIGRDVVQARELFKQREIVARCNNSKTAV